jgi:hypothetical protein
MQKVRFIDMEGIIMPLFLEAALNVLLGNENTSSAFLASRVHPADALMTEEIDRQFGGIKVFNKEIDLYRQGADGPPHLNTFFAHLALTQTLLEKYDRMLEEKAVKQEEKAAVHFSDTIRIQAMEAKERGQNIIIGLDTSWAEALEPHERSASQGLLSAISRLPLELKKLGLDNVIILRGKGDFLGSEILKKADGTNTPLTNVVVLAGDETLRADSFKKIISAPGEDRAFIAKVDPVILIKNHTEIRKGKEALFVPYLGMIEVALKLAFGERVLSEYEYMNYFSDKENPRFYHFIPKARAVPANKLKMLYDCQAKVIFAA